MALTNTSKPTTSVTNTAKVSFAELWSTITTTWASETRTWADMVSLIDNTARPASAISLLLLENGDYLLTEGGQGVFLESSQVTMTNTSKP